MLPSCGCANLKPGIAWVTDFTAPGSACFHPPMISSNDAMRTLHSVHPPNWSSILPFAMHTPHNNTIQRSLPTIQCARSTAPTLLCFLLQCTHHTKYILHYAHNTRHVHTIQYTHYTHRSTQCVLHTHYLQTDCANYRVVFPLHCSRSFLLFRLTSRCLAKEVESKLVHQHLQLCLL